MKLRNSLELVDFEWNIFLALRREGFPIGQCNRKIAAKFDVKRFNEMILWQIIIEQVCRGAETLSLCVSQSIFPRLSIELFPQLHPLQPKSHFCTSSKAFSPLKSLSYISLLYHHCFLKSYTIVIISIERPIIKRVRLAAKETKEHIASFSTTRALGSKANHIRPVGRLPHRP